MGRLAQAALSALQKGFFLLCIYMASLCSQTDLWGLEFSCYEGQMNLSHDLSVNTMASFNLISPKTSYLQL